MSLDTGARDALQVFAVGDIARGLQRLEHRIGTPIRGALWMEPVRDLALAERIGKAFAEAQLAFRQRLLASSALGAPAGRGLEEVGHARIVAQRKSPAEAGLFLPVMQGK